jgi:hypothetical protein
MNYIDSALRMPFSLASTLRRARVFHAHGVVAQGHAELGSPWWPVQGRVPVTVRLSRGVGLPGSVPDVLGLSIRLHLAARPWDLLLASTDPVTRFLPCPALSWSTAQYSSLNAFRTPDNDFRTWVLASPDAGQPRTASLNALSTADPLHFTLSLARSRSDTTAAGRLSLETPVSIGDDEEQPDFDPVLHHPDGLEMWPTWVADARRAAYSGSRSGRHSVDA